MNQFLREQDTCCLCQKTATTTILLQADFMGRQLKVMAALCKRCDKLKDRDAVLDAYVQRIFGGNTIQ